MSLMRPTSDLLSSKLRLKEMAFPAGLRAPDSLASHVPGNCSQQVEGTTSRHRRGQNKAMPKAQHQIHKAAQEPRVFLRCFAAGGTAEAGTVPAKEVTIAHTCD